MTQKTNKIFIDEFYSRPPETKYIRNETDVYHIVDIRSLDILDLKDCGPESKRRFRLILVVIDNCSKIGWTVPLKKKCSNNQRLFRKCFFFEFKKISQLNQK